MKQIMAIQMPGLTRIASLVPALVTFASCGVAMAENTPFAPSVGVYSLHTGGKIAYHYRVVNNSQQDIATVTIGRNNQNDGNPK